MAEDRPRGLKAQVKGPLIIAAALALAAFFAVFVFATGGTHNKPNIGLALGVAGAVFIVTLVVCATLILVDRPNDPSLGQGTGINRSSAEPKRKQPRMMLSLLRRLTANRRAEAVC